MDFCLVNNQILVKRIISLRFFPGESRFLKQDWIDENSWSKIASHLNIFRRISISETVATRTGSLFSGARILSSRQWSREFFWKECFVANLMDRIAISETLTIIIGNSFLKNENSFRQAMKQEVHLERMFYRKSYQQNRNFSNSYLKNLEFFFSRMRTLFG